MHLLVPSCRNTTAPDEPALALTNHAPILTGRLRAAHGFLGRPNRCRRVTIMMTMPLAGVGGWLRVVIAHLGVTLATCALFSRHGARACIVVHQAAPGLRPPQSAPAHPGAGLLLDRSAR